MEGRANRGDYGDWASCVYKALKTSTGGHGIGLEFPYFFAIIEYMRNKGYLSNFELIVILVLIRLGENAYGIPIARAIKANGGREVSLGSIYATLERLETKGLVSSTLGDPTPERGGRAKKYFSVTAKGVREVRETQRVLRQLWQGLRQLEAKRA